MVEKIWQQIEQVKLQFEMSKEQLIKEGVLSAGNEVTRDWPLSSEQFWDEFEVLGNLRHLLKFLARIWNLFSLFKLVVDRHYLSCTCMHLCYRQYFMTWKKGKS